MDEITREIDGLLLKAEKNFGLEVIPLLVEKGREINLTAYADTQNSLDFQLERDLRIRSVFLSVLGLALEHRLYA